MVQNGATKYVNDPFVVSNRICIILKNSIQKVSFWLFKKTFYTSRNSSEMKEVLAISEGRLGDGEV